MALDFTITSGDVTEYSADSWRIPILLEIFDDGAPATILHSRTWPVEYRSGQDAEQKTKNLLPLIQAEVDLYKRENNIETSVALSNALTYLNNNTTI